MSNLDQIKAISARMRDLREIYGLSEEELAAQLNINLESYQNYENAQCDIPVGFLNEFANRFKVNFMTLLTGEEPRLHVYEVVKKGEGLKIDRRKQYNYSNLAYNFIHKKMEPFLVKVPYVDGAAQIQCSQHEGQEFNYLLKGKIKMVIGQHQVLLEEGDAIYFDANSPHGMQALEGQDAEFLAIIAG